MSNPEKVFEVSQNDIYTYSGIISNEESIADIKEAAINKDIPKPMEDDTAIVEYLNQVDD